jgi:hypothetical protein
MRTRAVEAVRVTPRTLQIVLGITWLCDGLLQLQPKLFGPAFAAEIIRPSAAGQPGLVARSIDEMASLVSVHPAAVNVVFAAVQILVGIGLLRRETVRPALAVSFAWAAGVWCFGEGFGMLLTGTASPLSGAPGAVLLYAVVGVVAWPTRAGRHPAEAQSAAAAGLLGDSGARRLWAVVWLGMGVLWLLPANTGPDAVSGLLSNAAAASPTWLARLQTSLATALHGDGLAVALALGAASAVIGVGPLLARRSGVTPFLIAGAALSMDFWVLGQSFGGIVTGLATDPNAGPLFLLLALALFPNRSPAPEAASEPPAATPTSLAGHTGTLVPV